MSNTNEGLPPGVYQHGQGFRCRYRPETTSRSTKWSRVFPTAELCQSFLQAAQDRWLAGLSTPKLYGVTMQRTWTFSEFALEMWWPAYLRSEQTELTRKNMRALMKQHVLTSAWTRLPLAEISTDRLQSWFDVRVDDCVPSHLQQVPDYDYEADLHAYRNATGRGVRPTVDRLTKALWLVRQVFQLAVNSPEVTLSASPANAITLKRLSVEDRTADRQMKALNKAARVVTRDHVKSYAGLLPAYDQIPFWFMYACGLRISEAFGIRIRDWDRQERRLFVVRQYDPIRTADGQIVRTTPRLKTASSERYVYVCSRLAHAIDEYIARHHGDDPDPETPICVGAGGPSTYYSLRSAFRNRLHVISKLAGHTAVTRDGQTVACTARPHSLRKAIASELHRNPEIPDAAISVFLGHSIARQFDGADVTRISYLHAYDADLRACANYIGQILDELDVSLASADVSEYVTPREAADLLDTSVEHVYFLIRSGRLVGHRDGALRFVSAARARVHLERANVLEYRETRVPSADVAVPRAEVQRMLGISKAKLTRELARGDRAVLRYWLPPGGRPLTRATYVTVASIDAYQNLRSRKAAGELLSGKAAQRIAPVVARREMQDDVPHVYFDGLRHYERELLLKLSEAGRPEACIRVWEAARTCGLSNDDFVDKAQLSGDAGLPYAWVRKEVADEIYNALLDERAGAKARRASTRAANPILDAVERPAPDVWMPIIHAAARMQVTTLWLERALSGSGAPRQRYEDSVYVRRVDLDALDAIPEGYLTTAQVAQRLGRTTGWVSTRCKNGALEARVVRDAGNRRRYLVSESAVRAYEFRSSAAHTQEMNVYDVANELAVQPSLVVAAIVAGELPCTGPLDTIYQRRQARIARRDVEAFKVEHMPAASALTVAEVRARLAAEGVFVTVSHIHSLLARDKVPGATRHRATGPTWWLPPAAVAHIASIEAVGFVRQTDLLRQAGFTPTHQLHRELRRFIARGLLPGVTARPAGYRPVFPPECVEVVASLLRERGYTPTLDRKDASTTPPDLLGA